MGSSKPPLAYYFADKGFWPSALSEVLGNTSGKYTDAVTGVDTGTINGTASSYSVEAFMRSANVHAAITARAVRLNTVDSGKNWLCTTGGITATNALSSKYLPGACR